MKTEKPYSASQYHRDTSYDRGGLGGHMMDWAHQPRLIKSYPQVDAIPLIRKPDLPGIPFSDPATIKKSDNPIYKTVDIALLSTLLALSYTLTAKAMHGDQPFYYRSAASAGALYPCEIYLAQHRTTDIKAGVYHYNIYDFSLDKIREESIKKHSGSGMAADADESAAAFFYITGIFFRSSWKYRKRAYRYLLLDAGHLLSNLIYALKSQKLDFSIQMDFHDNDVNTLLGLDREKEVCLAMVRIENNPAERAGSESAAPLSALPPSIINAGRVSEKEVFYKELTAIHRAGLIVNKRPEKDDFSQSITQITPEKWHPIKSNRPFERADYVEILFKRRSKRNFVSTPMDQGHFIQMLDLACTAFSDHVPERMSSSLKLGILTGNIKETIPGFYLLDPLNKRFGQVLEGSLTEPMASACLDQMWLKNAAIHFLFMADMNKIDEQFGPRGYRYAMALSGIVGQSVYLGATAIGNGACGIGAIYDKEAADLLHLNTSCSLLYLVAAGPVKRA